MHIGILGMTESGKTLTAKCLIQQFRNKGVYSIVLDPLCDPAFNADFQTSNEDEFLRVVKSSRKCLVIVDETGDAGKYNKSISQLATKGRHWGHTCVFICQKATQVNPLIRDQWSSVFLFCSGRKSGELLAEEFNCEELKKCTLLKKGEYFYKTRFDPLVRGNIFDSCKRYGIFKK